jgi:predicted DNA-binding protein with PD1-like motif
VTGLRTGWEAAATRFLAVRLLPGDDLREALEANFAGSRAGFVAAAVGSLTRAHLRFAGCDEGTLIEGPLEIVALSGTFSPDGPHLHLAVAREDGTMAGGHLLAGSPVRTTAEVILGLTDAVSFHRRNDPRTGWLELFFEP